MNNQPVSCVRKRCRAALATAVHDASVPAKRQLCSIREGNEFKLRQERICRPACRAVVGRRRGNFVAWVATKISLLRELRTGTPKCNEGKQSAEGYSKNRKSRPKGYDHLSEVSQAFQSLRVTRAFLTGSCLRRCSRSPTGNPFCCDEVCVDDHW